MEDLDFTKGIIDYCPWATCIIYVNLNEKGEPFDFTYVHVNKIFSKLINKPLEELVNNSFFTLFPNGNSKWLKYYYDAAYKKEVIEFDDVSNILNLFMHISVIPTNKDGYCVCMLRDIKDQTLERLRHQQKLESALLSAEREKNYLDSLCFDYTNMYYIDFNSGEFEILKKWEDSNATTLIDSRHYRLFSDLCRDYCANFVQDIDKEYLLNLLDIDNIKRELTKQKCFLFNYEGVKNKSGKHYFEGRLIRVDNKEEMMGCLLAFRYIDDIVLKEKKIQEQLQKALDEANLSNEIISALSKVYISIYRIDLNKDHYEEVSSIGDMHYLTGVSGVASLKLVEICNSFAKDGYKDEVLKFFDLNTLKSRLMDEESIGIEFKTVDDSWFLSRFIVKKRDENNVPTNVLYVTRNISDQKRKEEFWAIEADNQRRANEAKSDFLSIVSHDIRTPINAIAGFSELGIKRSNNQEDIASFKKIKSASNYLTTIVNNVLDSNTLEKSIISLKKDCITISKLTGDVNKMIDSVIINSNKQSRHVLVHDIICKQIYTDVVKLEQIIFNLFNNACIYTPEDGEVSVNIYQKDLIDDSVTLCIEVKDTGVGMSDDFQKVMFDKYSREVDTRISQVRGLGLGLNIVKKYVKLLRGSVSVSSKKNEGSCFRVEIPVKWIDEIKDEKVVDNSTNKPLKLLIAEDNDLNYEILAGLIKVNYDKATITRARDGLECLKLLDDSFDCVLMDVQMPNMDGLTTIKEIRKGGSSVNIVVITANASNSDRMACLYAGANDFLAKPIDSARLCDILNSL